MEFDQHVLIQLRVCASPWTRAGHAAPAALGELSCWKRSLQNVPEELCTRLPALNGKMQQKFILRTKVFAGSLELQVPNTKLVPIWFKVLQTQSSPNTKFIPTQTRTALSISRLPLFPGADMRPSILPIISFNPLHTGTPKLGIVQP